MDRSTHLPVLGFSPEHQGILWLADIIGILILNFLDIFLRLDTFVLRKCSLVPFLLFKISFDFDEDDNTQGRVRSTLRA